MIKKKLGLVLFVTIMALAIILTGCVKSAESSKDSAKKNITVYTALEEEQIEPYLKSFKEKHPDIEVNIIRDSTGIITAKLLAEKENPQADVIWALAATSLLVADQEGMIESYAPKGIERVHGPFKDNKETPHWVGIDAWMTGIVCNTVELEKRGLPIPQTYEDLLDPKYKGLIVMPNPASSGTGYLTVSAFIQLMGESKAWEYMDKLNENIATYTHSGSKPAKLAGAGEYPIGISFGYKGLQLKEKGQPVETIFPSEGSGWDLEANALVKKENIKEEAKLFLDWAISDEVMKEYGKNYAITSVDLGIEPPEGFPKDPLKQLIENDFQWAAKNRQDILDQWINKYDGKSEAKN